MTTVLKLRADLGVDSVVPLRKALELIIKGAAEIEQPDPSGKFVKEGLPLPSVIRLKRYYNVPRRNMKWTRKQVFLRDGWRCAYCGKHLDKKDATIDHVVPQSLLKKRGVNPNTWTNTVCACIPCQRRKRDRTLSECGMRLLWEPKTPRGNLLVMVSDTKPEWRIYMNLQ